MPWFVFAASAALFWVIGRQLNLPPTTTGALAVVGGLGSTSFIGLPMIEAFYGANGMPTGILIDQLVTYLVLSTVRIVLICLYPRAPSPGPRS
jgi:predicted permease